MKTAVLYWEPRDVSAQSPSLFDNRYKIFGGLVFFGFGWLCVIDQLLCKNTVHHHYHHQLLCIGVNLGWFLFAVWLWYKGLRDALAEMLRFV